MKSEEEALEAGYTVVEGCQSKYGYKEADMLGKGSFAFVYKGIKLGSGEEVAIKVISKTVFKRFGEEMKRVIQSEVQILARLRRKMKKKPCDFIIKIEDCFQSSDQIFIVLEFCPDGSLDRFVKKQPGERLPERQAIKVAYQIASALQYLGQQNIAHRDLKPQNIFLKGGMLKLGDFGFAAQKDQFQTILGTYPYMAPQIFKEEEYSGAVDMWALGVILHELIFGTNFFLAPTHKEIKQKILKKDYTLERGRVSPHTQDFIRSCLSKDPKERISYKDLRRHPVFQEYFKETPREKQFKKIRMLIREYVARCEFLLGFGDGLSRFKEVARFAGIYSLRMGMYNLNVMSDKVKLQHNPFEAEGIVLVSDSQWRQFAKTEEFGEDVNFVMGKLTPQLWKKYVQAYSDFKDHVEAVFSQQDAKFILGSVPMGLDKPLQEELFMKQLNCTFQNLDKFSQEKGYFQSKFETLLAMRMNACALNFQKYIGQKKKFGEKDFQKLLQEHTRGY